MDYMFLVDLCLVKQGMYNYNFGRNEWREYGIECDGCNPEQCEHGYEQENLLVRKLTMAVQSVTSNFILTVVLCNAKDNPL
jgi:hypothetical protein